MDIRFIAIIFLIAALMEMISKALKKRRGAGIEDGSETGSVDPLRRALEDMQLLPGADDERVEPGRDIPVPGAGERRVRVRVVEPESTVEPVPPAEPTKVVPYRDRAPRQIEVRSREARPLPPRPRPRPRSRAERRPVPGVAGTARKEVAAEREGAVRGGGLGLGSMSGLRRLVVAREVLGPPLALRDNDPESGLP